MSPHRPADTDGNKRLPGSATSIFHILSIVTSGRWERDQSFFSSSLVPNRRGRPYQSPLGLDGVLGASLVIILLDAFV